MSTKEEIFEYVMDTPGNTNPAVLRSMLNGLPEGASLPEVDESDNGKVLGVVDGEWAKMSGGNNDFAVTLTPPDPDDMEGHWSSDKTATEIIAAIRSGHHAYVTYRVDTTSVGGPYDIIYAYLVRYADTGTPTVTFSWTQIYQEGFTNKLLTNTFIISDDAVTQQIKMIS